ncbi:MAG: hypothetical protein ABEJ42_04020 [Halobacteriaceae archaeon]
MRLECDATAVGDVTLVECTVAGGDRRRHVRVENRLDGPVWPPRRRGRPVAGWTAVDGGVPEDWAADGHRSKRDDAAADVAFEAVLAAGETLALGYATPAPPADPPVAVETLATGDDVRGADERGPADVLAAYGDPAPPRDAVPVLGEDSRGAPSPGETTAVPGAVGAWLEDVASRSTADGLDDGDRRALAAVAERVGRLRSGGTDGPAGARGETARGRWGTTGRG